MIFSFDSSSIPEHYFVAFTNNLTHEIWTKYFKFKCIRNFCNCCSSLITWKINYTCSERALTTNHSLWSIPKHDEWVRAVEERWWTEIYRHTDTVGYQHLIINVLENLITWTSIQNEQSIISSANIHYYGAGHNLYGLFM